MNLDVVTQSVFQIQSITASFWGMLVSLSVCLLLVSTTRWHGVLTLDQMNGVQKFHTEPTPRIGGIPIVLGVYVGYVQVPADVQEIIWPMLLASLPAFLFGLLEDITKTVSVTQRLLATLASGLFFWFLTDYSLSRVDVWGIDWLLSFLLVSVLFSAFAVAGLANSINIIDGFNGLASLTSILSFTGYALMAWQSGDMLLVSVSLVFGASVCGFFMVNWPLGKIFLGDGGSYFIGFALALLAILLVERNLEISPFAVLLVCFHPVIEVLFSIFRRRTKKLNPGHPDGLHFHTLVKRRYVAHWFRNSSNLVRNSITGCLVSISTLMTSILANFIYSSTFFSILALVCFSLTYLTIYARMVRYHWSSPIGFIPFKPRIKSIKSKN